MQTITSPKEFFGFDLGADRKIARWDRIVEYYKLLSSQSDRIQVTEMGPSTEGNPFLKVIITSPENFAHLEELRQINQTIADPRGLSQEEILGLVKKGKAVSVQSMSLHATEIGGTKMAPLLAYDLLTGDSPEILNILQNVVLVMVPCFNPDGQIMVTDWYNSTLDTPYEGCNYPSLYHKYTGHDNNRDAFAHNIVESQYVGDILFKEWTPQSYFDHHHMGSYWARIFVPPYKNPVRPYTDPLVYNELSLYGANMCYRMEQEDLSGASMMSQFPGWGHYGYHWITNSHNIAGMLSESANAKLATPLYIHPDQLECENDKSTPFYGPQVHFTHPWPGGWWRLQDIVKRQYCAAYTVLDTMAKNREQILYNMTQKALRQTKRGGESHEQAFLIPENQFDRGVLRILLKILLDQGIEIKRAASDLSVGAVCYPKGTYVIPLAQPKMGVVMNLLARTLYPDNFWTRDMQDALTAFDTASDTVAEYMGVQVIPAGAPVEGELAPFTALDCIPLTSLSQAAGYVISAKENRGYHAANLLLAQGFPVWRIDTCPWHDFYVEGDITKLAPIFDAAQATVRPVEKPYPQMTPLKPLRVAMYQRFFTGNADEGWTRLLFDNMAYSYTTVFDADIKNGRLKDFDVLILPSDSYEMLYGVMHYAGSPKFEGMMQYIGKQPPEKQSGLGTEGMSAIRSFVEKGGKLLAFNQSCDFAAEACGLKVKNLAKGLSPKEFNTHGSTLHMELDTQNPLCYGMPQKALAFHWNGPVLAIGEKFDAQQYQVAARYAKEDVLQSGLLTGEKLIAGTPALLQARCGQGEVVLYGFAPQHRCQTHGTFKLVFNALYR